MSAQTPEMTDKESLSRLLDRIGRMARGLQYCHGLNPAQWDSLRFVAQANRFSQTPGALAVFLGTTKERPARRSMRWKRRATSNVSQIPTTNGFVTSRSPMRQALLAEDL